MATKLKVNYEFVGDSTTPVTRTESIKHGDSMLNTVVNSKADNSTVSALAGRVSTNETNIATQTSRIDKLSNYVTPQMFYNSSDGGDWSNAFQLALNSSEKVYIPKGSYYLTRTIVIPEKKTICGAGSWETIIHTSANIAFTDNNCLILKQLHIAGNDANTCFKDDNHTAYLWNFEDVKITSFKTGIELGSVILCRFNNCGFHATEDMFKIKSLINAVSFNNCNIGDVKHFILRHSIIDSCEALAFNNCCFEGSNAESVIIKGDTILFSCTFNGCYFETDGLIFDRPHRGTVGFSGCWFHYNNGTFQSVGYLNLDSTPDPNQFLGISVSNCNFSAINAANPYSGNFINLPNNVHLNIDNCFEELPNKKGNLSKYSANNCTDLVSSQFISKDVSDMLTINSSYFELTSVIAKNVGNVIYLKAILKCIAVPHSGIYVFAHNLGSVRGDQKIDFRTVSTPSEFVNVDCRADGIIINDVNSPKLNTEYTINGFWFV